MPSSRPYQQFSIQALRDEFTACEFNRPILRLLEIELRKRKNEPGAEELFASVKSRRAELIAREKYWKARDKKALAKKATPSPKAAIDPEHLLTNPVQTSQALPSKRNKAEQLPLPSAEQPKTLRQPGHSYAGLTAAIALLVSVICLVIILKWIGVF